MCDTDSMAIVASEHGGLVPCQGGTYRTPERREAVKALSSKKVQEIVDCFEKLNPYDKKIVPGSVLNIVEELNFDSNKRPRQVWGWGNSAKRYCLFEYVDDGKVRLVKVSEHGLGLYYRPKEGRDSECEVAMWIKEGWEWLLNGVLGISSTTPDWFPLPVMRRVAITTPNVMTTLRMLNRDRARPYNFALSPVLLNLTSSPITLLGPFEKNSAKWTSMAYIDIHNGTVHRLNPASLLALPQTFEMVFHQYQRHPESKSLAPDGTPCKTDSAGLLKRYPVTATGFHLIGKETERGWEQSDDISTLMPSLVRYGVNSGIAEERVRSRLLQIPLAFLEGETGLSRHTILRARRGQPVHPRSINLLKAIVRWVPLKKRKT